MSSPHGFEKKEMRRGCSAHGQLRHADCTTTETRTGALTGAQSPSTGPILFVMGLRRGMRSKSGTMTGPFGSTFFPLDKII